MHVAVEKSSALALDPVGTAPRDKRSVCFPRRIKGSYTRLREFPRWNQGSWLSLADWTRYVEDLERRAALLAGNGGNEMMNKGDTESPPESFTAIEDHGQVRDNDSDHEPSVASRK